MAKMSKADVKRDLIVEAHILLDATIHVTTQGVDLDKLAQGMECLYDAFKLPRGQFAPNPRPTWPR